MFAKKTYRTTRWIEQLLTIGKPCREDLWLKIQPQYMVEVRGKLPIDTLPPYDGLDWKPVAYIRMSGHPDSQVSEIACLQCRLVWESKTINIYHRGDIRVTHSDL